MLNANNVVVSDDRDGGREKTLADFAFYGSDRVGERDVSSANGGGSSGGGGAAASVRHGDRRDRERDDDTIAVFCPRSDCARRVFVPKGFDLALVDCPHCRQPMR